MLTMGVVALRAELADGALLPGPAHDRLVLAWVRGRDALASMFINGGSGCDRCRRGLGHILQFFALSSCLT